MGLTEPWVNVVTLVAHANYTFRILVMNGVTHLSNEPLPYIMVNVTTNQAGRRLACNWQQVHRERLQLA